MSRFCFSSEEDFVESLLKNNVQLFLTADKSEVVQALRSGKDVSSLSLILTQRREFSES